MGTIFTDEEYRILLSALSRERKICEKIDAEMPGEVSLVKLMNNIERKISRIQYQNKDTNTERKGVLILDAPECCITPEGRVRCPLAWQQQFCSKYSPKGLDMTGGDWDKIYDSEQRPDFCPIRPLQSFKEEIIKEYIADKVEQLKDLETESQNEWAGCDDESAFGEMTAYRHAVRLLKGDKDE